VCFIVILCSGNERAHVLYVDCIERKVDEREGRGKKREGEKEREGTCGEGIAVSSRACSGCISERH
jgi:hypothetical protein